MAQRACEICAKALPPASDTGRPRRFCSDVCRSAARRSRIRQLDADERAASLQCSTDIAGRRCENEAQRIVAAQGREIRVCAACSTMTLSFLMQNGVPATEVEVRPLPGVTGAPTDTLAARLRPDVPAKVSPPSRTHILFIEDDLKVAEAISSLLRRHQYTVFHAPSGSAGLTAAHERHHDLILLDLGLPDIDGLQALSRLREFSDVPVVVLTARGDERSRSQGLHLGADDYLVKPCGAEELLTRLERALRRAAPRLRTERLYDDGVLRLDSLSTEVSVNRVPLALTSTEFRVLDLLVRNAGRVQTSRFLLAKAWDAPQGQDTTRVKFTISRLRGKLDSTDLGGAAIMSVRGVGYLYQVPGARPAIDSAVTRITPPPAAGYGHASNVLGILESRETEADRSDVVRLGPLEIDMDAPQVRVAGQTVLLTPKEFRLLTLLVASAGTTLSKEELYDEIWDSRVFPPSLTFLNAVAVSLRQKLGVPGLMEIRRGGCRIVPQDT